MSRVANLLLKRTPADTATSDVWDDFLKAARTLRGEIKAEQARVEDDRVMRADSVEEFGRIGKRLQGLDGEIEHVDAVIDRAERKLAAARQREEAESEAERIRNLDACMQARAETLLRADHIIEELVAVVREAEAHEKAALTFTPPASMARIRGGFQEDHSKLIPLLIDRLDGCVCAMNLGGLALQWPANKTKLWSAHCGIRPPEPSPCNKPRPIATAALRD